MFGRTMESRQYPIGVNERGWGIYGVVHGENTDTPRFQRTLLGGEVGDIKNLLRVGDEVFMAQLDTFWNSGCARGVVNRRRSV